MEKIFIVLCVVLFIFGFTSYFVSKNSDVDKINTDLITTANPLFNSSEEANLESYATDFPVITKAILFRGNISEEIKPNDIRIVKTINYIMYAFQNNNYSFVNGVIENSYLESFFKMQADMYLILELEAQHSVHFSRFDKALISRSSVVFIDSDSVSYHGEGNPFNYCITPYRNDYKESNEVPYILDAFF